MTPPTKFAHVVFSTHRYDEMIAFYRDVFGSTIQHRDERLCFMTYDEEHHRHAFVNLGPREGAEPAPTREGIAHLAYTWPDLGALLEVYRLLRDRLGRRPARCLRHGPTLSMYYADPDGNFLEFQIDLLTPAAANDFMTSPAFAANPIGERFDPDELLQRFDGGDEVESLVFRSDQEHVPLVSLS